MAMRWCSGGGGGGGGGTMVVAVVAVVVVSSLGGSSHHFPVVWREAPHHCLLAHHCHTFSWSRNAVRTT